MRCADVILPQGQEEEEADAAGKVAEESMRRWANEISTKTSLTRQRWSRNPYLRYRGKLEINLRPFSHIFRVKGFIKL